MSKNKQLFEEAIADAKTLREVAVANAKAALEESFAPRIQSMFEKRVMEQEEIDEAEEVDEVYVDDQDDLLSEEEDIDLEELFNSLSEEDELGEYAETQPWDADGDGDVDADDVKKLSEEDYDLEEILRELEEESNEINESDDEDEDDLDEAKAGAKGGVQIHKNIKNASAGGHYKGPKEIRENEGTMFEKATGSEGIDEVTVDELRDMIQDAIAQALGKDGDEDGEEVATDDTEFDMDAEAGAEGDEAGDVDLGIEDDETETEEKPAKKGKVDEIVGSGTEFAQLAQMLGTDIATAKMAVVGAGLSVPIVLGAIKLGGDAVISKLKNLVAKSKSKPAAPSMDERKRFKGTPAVDESADNDADDLKEAIKVIKTLRGQLNEVNLLNAKLIYVNRLFKSNNLTESQKVNVVNSFDKAQTLNEAKNIFEVLKNTVKQTKVAPRTALKESKSFASSVIGGRSATPIIEADAQIERMKKLAGII